jgi:hypothetical protein
MKATTSDRIQSVWRRTLILTESSNASINPYGSYRCKFRFSQLREYLSGRTIPRSAA